MNLISRSIYALQLQTYGTNFNPYPANVENMASS